MPVGKVRPQLQRTFVARQRLLEPPQLFERIAPIGERLGIVRPQRQRVVIACQRLLVPLQLMQGRRLECASTNFGRSATARS